MTKGDERTFPTTDEAEKTPAKGLRTTASAPEACVRDVIRSLIERHGLSYVDARAVCKEVMRRLADK